ncbi:MAG: ABC transporter permease [Candidatus Aminicenantes bacterium]|nr:ABC transporter permease [Candidatus Aminicenantes bacterium]
MLLLKIAFRNIFRQKRRTVLTGLSMFGGFVMAAVFIGWADGSYNHIIDDFTRHNFGHIQIHEKDYLDRPSLYKTIDDYPRIRSRLEGIGEIDSFAPRVYSAGLASVGEKSAGVRIIGIDPARERSTTAFQKKVAQGEFFPAAPAHRALLGKDLAGMLHAKVGDDIVVVSQGADGSIANDQYPILGLVDSGDPLSDRTSLYLHVRDAQELLVLGGRIHEIAVNIGHLKKVGPTAGVIRREIGHPGLAVDPWQVFARGFYLAMKADMEGMWISLVIIVLIVAIGVLNTVLMSVLERTREYGVLKAVGTKPGQIVQLILTEVNIMAFFSVLLGFGVALALNSILASHGIRLGVEFSYGGMTFDTFKSEINARSFIIPAVTIFVSASLVGLIPALKAARTDAARAMRTH